MNQYQMAIEELALSGSVYVKGSTSTVYRWKRAINEILEHGNYDWRVKADIKTGVLTATAASS